MTTRAPRPRVRTMAGRAPVTIEIAAGAVTVSRAGGKARSGRWPLPGPQLDDVPDWRSILGGLLDGTATPSSGRFTFNSGHLSRFRMQSARAAAVSGGWPAELRWQWPAWLGTGQPGQPAEKAGA